MSESSKPYQIDDDGNIRFRSERKPGEVRVPNYVYDLWLPLLGMDAIGVYSVYCRLEYEDSVKKITQDRLAKVCRMSKTTLRSLNDKLAECGFIEITVPKGRARLKHFTTEIIVKDPPQEVSAILIQKYQPESGYQPLTIWLCEAEHHSMYTVPAAEVLHSTSGQTSIVLPGVPDSTPSIATLDILQPSVVAEVLPAPQNGADELSTSVEEKATEPPITTASHSENHSTQLAAGSTSERPALVTFCMDWWACAGGEAAKRADQLMGTAKSGAWKDASIEPGMIETEAKCWKLWVERSRHELPRAAWQVQKSVYAFRASQAYADAIADANAPPAEPEIVEAVSPDLALARQREYRELVANLAASKKLTPERKPHVAAA
jgi:hypothetical protein